MGNEDEKAKGQDERSVGQSEVDGLVSCDLNDCEIALLRRLLRIYISEQLGQGATAGDLWVSIDLKDKLTEAGKRLSN